MKIYKLSANSHPSQHQIFLKNCITSKSNKTNREPSHCRVLVQHNPFFAPRVRPQNLFFVSQEISALELTASVS